MSIGSLGITLKDRDTIEFHASRSEETAWLAIRIDDTQCEIRMERAHVAALRDQLPDVLKGLDRYTTENAACEQAENAAGRATDAATKALDRARAAEDAGDHEIAASLRAAAAEATQTAGAVDQAVRDFVEATLYADRAADRLVCSNWRAEGSLTAP